MFNLNKVSFQKDGVKSNVAVKVLGSKMGRRLGWDRCGWGDRAGGKFFLRTRKRGFDTAKKRGFENAEAWLPHSIGGVHYELIADAQYDFARRFA